MALDPLIVSHFALTSQWLWAVTGKCRPIRLLYGVIPHTRDTTCDLTFVPRHLPSPPKTVIYSLVCVIVGMVGRGL